MIKREALTIYIEKKDKELLIKASNELRLNLSSFCRSCSVKEAMKILGVKNGDTA